MPNMAKINSAPLVIRAKAVPALAEKPKELKAKAWMASWEPRSAGIGIIDTRQLKPRIDKAGNALRLFPKNNTNSQALNHIIPAFKKARKNPFHIVFFLGFKKLKISFSISNGRLSNLLLKILPMALAILSLLKDLK